MSDIVERFDLSIHLGPTIVAEIRALEERVVRCGAEIRRLHSLAYAPDGKEMRKALCEEAEKRGNAEADVARLTILVEEQRRAVQMFAAQLIVAENGSTLNGNVTIPKQTLPASIYDPVVAIAARGILSFSSDERA